MILRFFLSWVIFNNIWMGLLKNLGNIELRELLGKEEEYME